VDCPVPTSCGDGFCGLSESPSNCPVDCVGGRFCGDGMCTDGDGENEFNCPVDCGQTGPLCGNRRCEGLIEQFTCPVDCGPPPFPLPFPIPQASSPP
jgi:hypothetical protein